MARPRIKNKKEKTSVYLNPELIEEFKNYCEELNIENYSEHIEKLILKYMNDDNSIINALKK